MAKNTSNTGNKQEKRKRGNPNINEVNKATQFKPNNPETGEIDPRINRKGRLPPKDLTELNAAIDALFAEMITDKTTGATMDKLSIALNRLLLSKNPSGPIHILDRRFGKVLQSLEVKNEGAVTLNIVYKDKPNGDGS